jgi:dTDP-glucose 4,6-dehydratase
MAGAAYASSGKAPSPEDLYARLKRDDERDMRDACRAVDARLVIARVFAASGPFLPRGRGYLLGDLVDRARSEQALVVETRGELYRSYVAVADVVALMIAILLHGDEPETVFATGGDPVEAGELARCVRDTLGPPTLEIRRERDPAAPVDHYVGDDEAFQALADRFGIVPTPLDEQIRRTRLR